MQEHSLDNRNWQQTVAGIYNLPTPLPPYEPNRSAEEYLNTCATWTPPPAPDEEAHAWYRAATTLQSTVMKSAQEYQQMLQLYEAAARRGHYTAIKQLTIIYSTPWIAMKADFPAEPEKARYWLNYGLKQGWTGALEWLANALIDGDAEFPHDPQLGMAYLQLASDRGVALAQWQLSLEFRNPNDVAKEEALLECAARQDLHAALRTFASYTAINKKPREALELYHRAVMAGGESGGEAAYTLSQSFGSNRGRYQRLGTFEDPIRKKAYAEIDRVIRDGEGRMMGNMFMRFPRLNDVLPLPPAKVTEWKGIYSAMSEDDAAYYQNPPPPEFYLKQVEAAGLLVPLEYLTQPVMRAD